MKLHKSNYGNAVDFEQIQAIAVNQNSKRLWAWRLETTATGGEPWPESDKTTDTTESGNGLKWPKQWPKTD